MTVKVVTRPKKDGSGEMEYGIKRCEIKPYRTGYKLSPHILKVKSEKKAMERFFDIIIDMQARGYKTCRVKKIRCKKFILTHDGYD